MEINKPLDEVFKDIVNIVKSYDVTKKFQLNNKLLKQVKEYILNFTKGEEWTSEKRNMLFDYLISLASCERHEFDLFGERDLAIFYYQIQCMLSTVKCNCITV